MLKLYRVSYGNKNTPEDMREYRIDNKGPVGCLKDFKEYFPDDDFLIIDHIENKEIFQQSTYVDNDFDDEDIKAIIGAIEPINGAL